MVPTDGSEAALDAARHALELARELGATVHVVYVVDESAGNMLLSSGSMATVLEELSEEGETVTDDVAALPEAEGVSVETDVVRGTRVDHAIHSYAEDHGIDLIVMGSYGKRGLDRLLGSTTQRVMTEATVPVLVVGWTGDGDDAPDGR